jgi:hypothetical protein
MNVRTRDMLYDLILTLAAFVPMIVADCYSLNLTWPGSLILPAAVVLTVCVSFLWQMQRGSYERLTRRTRVFIVFFLAGQAILFVLSGFHSARIHFVARGISYCVTASVILFCIAEGISQSRTKQTFRSVKGNGTI